MIIEVIGGGYALLLSNIIDKGVVGSRGIPYIIGMGITMVITALFMMAGGVGGAYLPLRHHQALPMI